MTDIYNGGERTFVPDAPVTQNFQYHVFKRGMDIIVSLFALVILSPFLLLVGTLIRLTSAGPAFYAIDWIGRGGKPYHGYKFRTMVQNADAIKAQLLSHNEMSGPVFKMTNDPRITRFGKILRKFSIDEFPQLWSVLKGDMSLVGPRPPGPHEWVNYEPWQRRKLSVTPGMTCLWQVSGRNRISDFSEWVKLDLEYIDNWSLWLDIKILYRTALVVLMGTGK